MVRRGRCGEMQRSRSDIRAVALGLVRRLVVECRGAGFDEQQASGLIVLLVADAVARHLVRLALVVPPPEIRLRWKAKAPPMELVEVRS